MSVPTLSELKAHSQWQYLDTEKKLDAYDRWSADVISVSGDATEEQRKELLEKLEVERQQIQAEQDGTVLDSASRGVLTLASSARTGVAAFNSQYVKNIDAALADPRNEKHRDLLERRRERALQRSGRQLQEAEVDEQLAGQLPQDAGMREFIEAKGFEASTKALFNNFGSIVANGFAESAPMMLSPIAGGIVGGITTGNPVGAGVGAFVGGAAPEFTISYREALQEIGKENGFNTASPEGLAEAMADEKTNSAAVKRGLIRAGIIGGVDAATGGAGAKLGVKAGEALVGKTADSLAKELTKNLTAVGVSAAIGAPAGSAGEFAAQLASGQELDAKDIALEGIVQGGTAFGQAVTETARTGLTFTTPDDVKPGQKFPINGELHEVTETEPVTTEEGYQQTKVTTKPVETEAEAIKPVESRPEAKDYQSERVTITADAIQKAADNPEFVNAFADPNFRNVLQEQGELLRNAQAEFDSRQASIPEEAPATPSESKPEIVDRGETVRGIPRTEQPGELFSRVPDSLSANDKKPSQEQKRDNQPENTPIQPVTSLDDFNARAKQNARQPLASETMLNTLRNVSGESDLKFADRSAAALTERGYLTDTGTGSGRSRYRVTPAGREMLGIPERQPTSADVNPLDREATEQAVTDINRDVFNLEQEQAEAAGTLAGTFLSGAANLGQSQNVRVAETDTVRTGENVLNQKNPLDYFDNDGDKQVVEKAVKAVWKQIPDTPRGNSKEGKAILNEMRRQARDATVQYQRDNNVFRGITGKHVKGVQDAVQNSLQNFLDNQPGTDTVITDESVTDTATRSRSTDNREVDSGKDQVPRVQTWQERSRALRENRADAPSPGAKRRLARIKSADEVGTLEKSIGQYILDHGDSNLFFDLREDPLSILDPELTDFALTADEKITAADYALEPFTEVLDGLGAKKGKARRGLSAKPTKKGKKNTTIHTDLSIAESVSAETGNVGLAITALLEGRNNLERYILSLPTEPTEPVPIEYTITRIDDQPVNDYAVIETRNGGTLEMWPSGRHNYLAADPRPEEYYDLIEYEQVGSDGSKRDMVMLFRVPAGEVKGESLPYVTLTSLQNLSDSELESIGIEPEVIRLTGEGKPRPAKSRQFSEFDISDEAYQEAVKNGDVETATRILKLRSLNASSQSKPDISPEQQKGIDELNQQAEEIKDLYEELKKTLLPTRRQKTIQAFKQAWKKFTTRLNRLLERFKKDLKYISALLALGASLNGWYHYNVSILAQYGNKDLERLSKYIGTPKGFRDTRPRFYDTRPAPWTVGKNLSDLFRNESDPEWNSYHDMYGTAQDELQKYREKYGTKKENIEDFAKVHRAITKMSHWAVDKLDKDSNSAKLIRERYGNRNTWDWRTKERWEKDFEKFLKRKKAPQGLDRAFTDVRNNMRDIYNGLSNGVEGISLSDSRAVHNALTKNKNPVQLENTRRLLINTGISDSNALPVFGVRDIGGKPLFESIVDRSNLLKQEKDRKVREWLEEDQKIYENAKKFTRRVKTTKDLLNWVAETDPDGFGPLAKYLAKNLPKFANTDIVWLEPDARSFAETGRLHLSLIPSTEYSGTGVNINTAIHEIVHGITSAEIWNNFDHVNQDKWREQLQRFADTDLPIGEIARAYMVARDQRAFLKGYAVGAKATDQFVEQESRRIFSTATALDKRIAYALANVHEFVAMAFEDREFQQWLDSIPDPGRNQSIWKTFVDAIKKMLRIPVSEGSLLETVVVASDNTFLNKKKRNRFYGGKYAGQGSRLNEADTKRDADYLKAVEAGDMETAQRMVDEAAKAAGYDVGPVYHGSPSDQFTEFNPEKIGSATNEVRRGKGFYFFDEREKAERYAMDSGFVLTVYLKGDIKIVPAKRSFDNANEYIVKNPNQIKSADPVTYDANGNVIPLSQRFDDSQDSILYQEFEDAPQGFYDRANKFIGLLPTANPSTLLHEFIHAGREMMAGTPELKTLENFYGVKDGNWTRDQEETFARHGERYFRDGKAPKGASQKVRDAFATFADVMRKIYRTLKGSPIEEKVPKEVREFFDTVILAGDTEADVDPSIRYDRTQAAPAGELAAAAVSQNSIHRIPVEPLSGDVRPNRDVLFDAARNFGKNVKYKGQARRTYGTYNTTNSRVSIRYEGDLDTTAHELGHAIDDQFNIGGTAEAEGLLPDIDAELLTPTFQATSAKDYDLGQKRAEGFAEFIRALIVNPDAARLEAPKTAELFDRLVSPKTVRALNQFSRDIRAWEAGSAGEQILANVQLRPDSKLAKAIKLFRGAKKGNQDGFVVSGWDRVAAKWLDDKHPFLKAVNYIEEANGEKPLPSSDPRIMARLLQGIGSKEQEVLENGMVNANGDFVLPGGVEWLLEPFGKQTTEQIDKDLRDATALLVAERTVELADRFARPLREAEAELAQLQQEIRQNRTQKAKLIESLTGWYGDRPDISGNLERGKPRSIRFALKAIIDKESSTFTKKPNRKALDEARELKAILDTEDRAAEVKRSLPRLERNAKEDQITGAGAGIRTDLSVAQEAIAEYKKDPARYARLKEAGNRYRQWADANLKYMVEKGRLSQEAYDNITAENTQYVALSRIMETAPGEEMEAMAFGSGKNLGSVSEVLRKIKGSSKTIRNPYIVLLESSGKIMRESDRNEVLSLFADMIDNDRRLYDGDPNQFASVGSRIQEGTGAKNTQTIYRNGQKEVWQFDDDIHKALKGYKDAYQLPWIATFMAKALKWGITNMPAFAIRNLIRDTQGRFLVSRAGIREGLASSLPTRGQNNLRKLKLGGGDQAGYYTRGETDYMRVLDMATRELATDKRNILISPKEFVRFFGSEGPYMRLLAKGEQSNRLAEYRASYAEGIKRGYNQHDAHIFASAQARDLMDFAIAGEHARFVNQVIPFFNAAIQGTRRNVIAVKENSGQVGIRFLLFAVMPTIIIRAIVQARGDEEEYEEMPAYLRDFYWNIKLTDDLWLRIPKNFEAGVLASGVDRAISKSLGYKFGLRDYLSSLSKSSLPVDFETAISGPFSALSQAYSNKDFFRDKAIVPSYQSGVDLDAVNAKGERLRNTDYASRLGKGWQMIGEAIGLSSTDVGKKFFDARVGDFLFKSTLGNFGETLTRASNIGRSDTSNKLGIKDFGLFVNSPAYAAQSVQEVYKLAENNGLRQNKMFDDLDELIGQYFNATKQEAREKNFDSVSEYRDFIGRQIRREAKRVKPILEAEIEERKG